VGDAVPEYTLGDAFVLFCFAYSRLLMDPASAAAADAVPSPSSSSGRVAADLFNAGWQRWYLYWMLFNKTVRVVFSAARLSPPLQLFITLSVYFVLPPHAGVLRSHHGGFDGSPGYSSYSSSPDLAEDPDTPAAFRWVLREGVLPLLRGCVAEDSMLKRSFVLYSAAYLAAAHYGRPAARWAARRRWCGWRLFSFGRAAAAGAAGVAQKKSRAAAAAGATAALALACWYETVVFGSGSHEFVTNDAPRHGGAVRVESSCTTHSLKAPGFNPFEPIK
jgi:hypothetical protein